MEYGAGEPKVMKPSILSIDTLDDRREIVTLLARLSPENRVLFLARACLRTPSPSPIRPNMRAMRQRVVEAATCEKADQMLTNEIYGDLLMASTQFNLDLLLVAIDLQNLVRSRSNVDAQGSAGGERTTE